MPDGNGWGEWQRHVLAELQRLDDRDESQDGRLQSHATELAVLKVKVGLIGGLAGLVAGVIGAAIGRAIVHLVAP